MSYNTRLACWFAFIPPLAFIAILQILGLIPSGVLA